ncbi:MAG: cytochrome c [Campylobacterales bacterium]|nr:cytochrome c [Campylobacterales bacterium]
MKKLLFLLPLVMLNAGEDFISHYEYGEMLYNNPRGVSCAQCHGEDGSGTMIVSLKDANGVNEIVGADIRQKTFEEIVQSLNGYHEIMPRYYLTDEEVKAIYDFLKKKNKRFLIAQKDTNTSR